MESLASSLEAIARVNKKLDGLLAAVAPAPASFSLTAEQMAAILAEVMRVGDWLQAGLARDPDPVLQQELGRYRLHLEQLRATLPGVYTRLLTERSRIQAERAHLESASAWAQSVGKQKP